MMEDTECDCDECCSRRGFQGLVGFQGADERGPQGPIGFQYPTVINYGFQGAQGSIGDYVQGKQGNVGPEGPTTEGAQGFQGSQGSEQRGQQGDEGPPGFQGFDGGWQQGLEGSPGVVGTQGPPGPPGFQGIVGQQGPQGPFGPATFFASPVQLNGQQAFAAGTTNFANVVIGKSAYYENMTVSVTAAGSATGFVKNVYSRPFVIGPQGGTVVVNSLFSAEIPSVVGTNVPWSLTTDAPVTLTWTRTIYFNSV